MSAKVAEDASLLPNAACARYGLLGLPLAFVALPLYVVLPAHYAQTLGVPLATLGVILLTTRLLDALVDPWLGRWSDRLLQRHAWRAVALASVVLGLGFAALFFPPVTSHARLLASSVAALTVTFVAFSLTSVIHLAWGTRLGGSTQQRARVVGWREGCGLLGVVVANVLATQAGLAWTTLALWAMLLAGVASLARAPLPLAPVHDALQASPVAPPASAWQDISLPWRGAGFRRLLALFLVNGVASAMPATLVLFFIQDRLQAPAWAPWCLGGYFLVAAASVPWWVGRIARLGPSRAWALGMVLNIASFAGVLAVGAGDTGVYLAICLASGWALGADLTAPGTLLTGVVRRAGHQGKAEGSYAGWWQWASKLNLALAAGLSLPLLQAMGYAPGARDPQALQALTWAYGLLPCLFKLAALVLCLRLSPPKGSEC